MENLLNYYVIRTKFRNALLKYLAGSNIKTQIHYPCALPFQDAYKHFGFTPNDFPIAFKLQSEILSLPFYPFMEEEEIIYLKDNLNKFFDKKSVSALMIGNWLNYKEHSIGIIKKNLVNKNIRIHFPVQKNKI